MNTEARGQYSSHSSACDPSNHPSPLQHRMQQHIATRSDVLRLRVFNLVMADAVFAGDEDHAAWGQLGHVDGVVAGA